MEKPKMITQSRIIGEYGWTKSLINKFLPDPILKRNPHYSKAAPMRLWEEDTIKKVMQTEEFQKAMKKASKRKESANKAVDTKRSNMHRSIEEFIESISIKILPDDELRSKTLQAKQVWYQKHSHYDEDFDEDVVSNAYEADEDTLVRWVVNYIRHNLLDYDDFLYRIDGKVGAMDAYPEVKVEVLKKIAVAYPKYSDECDRQIFWVELNNRYVG